MNLKSGAITRCIRVFNAHVSLAYAWWNRIAVYSTSLSLEARNAIEVITFLIMTLRAIRDRERVRVSQTLPTLNSATLLMRFTVYMYTWVYVNSNTHSWNTINMSARPEVRVSASAFAMYLLTSQALPSCVCIFQYIYIHVHMPRLSTYTNISVYCLMQRYIVYMNKGMLRY